MIRHGALAPGTRVADLEIEHCIGASPVGFEYSARTVANGRRSRLLEYMPEGLADRRGTQVSPRMGAAEIFDVGRRAFQLDANRFSLPRHDALAVVQRLLVEHGTAYMQMLWQEGTPLTQAGQARDATPTPEIAREWLLELGSALAHLHRSGVIHGGVSERRVVCRPDGQVELGLPDSARWALASSVPGLIDTDDPAIAPEQLLDPRQREQTVGPWTDVYGLACIAHRFITSHQPPPAHDRQAVQQRAALSAFAGADRWSTALLVAVDRALSPEPSARPRSMDDFLAAMGLLERRSQPRTPAPVEARVNNPVPESARGQAQAQRPRARGPAWRWLVALLFVAAAWLAVWTSMKATGTPKLLGLDQRPSEIPVSAATLSKG